MNESSADTSLLDQVKLFLAEEKSVTVKIDVDKQVFFSTILENFVHFEFSEDEARMHWKNILERAHELSTLLGKRVPVYTAVVDYFTSTEHILDRPMLIEVHVFRETEQLAMIDSLTGLFNRRYMDIMLRKEFMRCRRYDKNLSIAIIDIDNFKKVNDTYGHQFGDSVLEKTADLIKSTIREEDIACRYGGEEFLLILPETDADGVYHLSERVRTCMNNDPFFQKHGISFSSGTATYPLCATETVHLVSAADKALYHAKFTGKNKTYAAPFIINAGQNISIL